MHAAAATRLQSGVLRGVGRVHALSGALQRVLQPAPALGAVHHGQHIRPAGRLQAHRPSQRQHIHAVHRLSSKY